MVKNSARKKSGEGNPRFSCSYCGKPTRIKAAGKPVCGRCYIDHMTAHVGREKVKYDFHSGIE